MKLKNKKITIIIMSIIVMIIGIAVASLFATGVLETESIEMEGIEMPEISAETQVILLSGTAVINFVIILLAQNLLKYKKVIIIFEVIQALIGGMQNIITAIISIVILCIQTTDVVEEKRKIELPVLEKVTSRPKWVYIIVWIATFLLVYTKLLNYIIVWDLDIVSSIILSVVIYILQIIVFSILLKEDLKRDFKAFKTNFKTYMGYILPKLGIFLLVYMVIAIILVLAVGSISTNQQILNKIPIWITVILAIVIAPFIEELVFRGALRKIFTNDKVFVIISAILFGLVHVMFAEENLLMYLYIIPYGMLGFFLARTYAKTDNIFTNMFVHFLWNTIAILMSVLISL